MPQTRRDTSIFLIGNYQPQIIGSKLPSNGDVLRVLYFNIHEVGLNDVNESAKLVINEVLTFWSKARITTKYPQDCVKKVASLYATHRNLKRSEKRNFPADVRNREAFIETLDDLFDISHAEALVKSSDSYVKLEEDRQFLISQQKKGREGYMFGIDWELYKKELRAEERQRVQLERKRKNEESLERMREFFFLSFYLPMFFSHFY